MSSTQVDRYKTALENGFSVGQAEMLASWCDRDFRIFMGEVIRVDGVDKVWVTMDGRVQKEPKAGLDPVRKKQSWY